MVAQPNPVVRPVPFKEAIAAFERRAGNLVQTDRWTEMWHEEHATAFTVARSAGYDILGDISGELTKALTEGQTFESFAKNLRPILQKKGWWGKSVEDSGEVVQLGSQARLRTIYDVNMRTSYSAGAWERAQRTKRAFPYSIYEGIDDQRQRPAHHAWMGTCVSIDDPWLDTHWCPCGWKCRCWNRQVTRLEAEEHGITKHPATGPSRKFTNKSTGEVVEVPWGIDPGFGYNPGKAALDGKMRGDAAKVMADKLAAAPPRVAAMPLPKQILADQTEEFGRWIDGLDLAKPKGEQRVVGAFADPILDFLTSQSVAPESGAITISDHAVSHAMRDAKGAKRPDIETLKALPALLAAPDAVLWDIERGTLLYVVAIDGASATRLVVQLDRFEKVREPVTGKRRTIRTNAIVNGQVLDVEALRDRKRFELVDGKL
jgi:SPP1 gp7 family putative phage head morphogenesis protein